MEIPSSFLNIAWGWQLRQLLVLILVLISVNVSISRYLILARPPRSPTLISADLNYFAEINVGGVWRLYGHGGT